MDWPARAVIIQKPVNRDSGLLPLEVLQGASLEHIQGVLVALEGLAEMRRMRERRLAARRQGKRPAK